MMVNWKFAWPEARHRPSRGIPSLWSASALAVLASLALAFGAGAKAAERDANPTAGKPVLGVVYPALDERVVNEIAKLPNVEAVTPFVRRNTILSTADGKQHILIVLGVDPEHDRQVRGYEVTTGELSDKAGGIMLDEVFAAKAGVKVDQTVEFLTKLGWTKTKVVGLYKTKLTKRDADGEMLMPIRAAQHFFKTPRQIDSIQFVLKPGADQDEARTAINSILVGQVEFVERKEEGSSESTTKKSPAQPAGSAK